MARERPRCLYCNKLLTQMMDQGHEYWDYEAMRGMTDSERRNWKRRHTTPTGAYGYGGTNLFCTQRCGHWYAVKLVNRQQR